MDWHSSQNKGFTEWSMRDNRNGYIDRETAAYVQKLFQQSHHNGINFEKYFDIPIHISDSGIPQMHEFSDCEVHQLLLDNLNRFGYTKPTPVQQYAIPVSLLRRDLMACAQTGSGKTAAYLYPMIAKMLQDGPPPSVNQNDARPLTLVLAPTRELSVQIYEETLKFTFSTGIRVVVVYGGASVEKQHNQLVQGADIIIATPGRLIDFIDKGVINLNIIRYLILDEADRMLDMGFEPQLIRILTAIKKIDRETIMCSATFPPSIQNIAKKYLKDYVYLTVGRVGSTTENIIQKLYLVKNNGKQDFLVSLLCELEGQILIFVEKKASANDLNHFLSGQGVMCTCIHGDRGQMEREKALNDFKNNRIKILIATDVASRGLDIPNVAYVIVYDLPNNIDSYVHRIGRTGRIGNTGMAIALVDERASSILSDLLMLLEESKQEVPDWFRSLASGNSNFNSEDFSSSSHSRGGAKRSGFRNEYDERNSYVKAGNSLSYAESSNSYSKPMSGQSRATDHQSGYGYSGPGGSGSYQRGGYSNNKRGFGNDNLRGGLNARESYAGQRGQYDNQRGGHSSQRGGNGEYRGASNHMRGSNDQLRGGYEYGGGNESHAQGNNSYGGGNNDYRGNYERGSDYNSRGTGRSGNDPYANLYQRGGYGRSESNSFIGNRGRGRGAYENSYSESVNSPDEYINRANPGGSNTSHSNYSKNEGLSNYIPQESSNFDSRVNNRRLNDFRGGNAVGQGRGRGGQDNYEGSYYQGGSRAQPNFSSNYSRNAVESHNWGTDIVEGSWGNSFANNAAVPSLSKQENLGGPPIYPPDGIGRGGSNIKNESQIYMNNPPIIGNRPPDVINNKSDYVDNPWFDV